MARAVFGDLIDHFLPVERNARITQVVGKSFSNRSIRGLKKDGTATTGRIGAESAALRADLHAVLSRNPDAAVFGDKSMIEALCLGEDSRAGHFSAIRGRNSRESASKVVSIGRWITFYNHQRPHTAHGRQPPAVVYFNAIITDQQVQAVALTNRKSVQELGSSSQVSGNDRRPVHVSKPFP